VLGCEAKSSLSWDDPLPFVRSSLHRLAGPLFEREQPGTWHERNRANSGTKP
jgi:hypothetical protein